MKLKCDEVTLSTGETIRSDGQTTPPPPPKPHLSEAAQRMMTQRGFKYRNRIAPVEPPRNQRPRLY